MAQPTSQSMSNEVFCTETHSEDGHATMSVNRAPTRNRSSTIGGTPSRSRPDSSFGTDLLKPAVEIGKSSNQVFVNRVCSNSNIRETGSHYGQPSRLAMLGDHFKGRRNSILLTASDVLGLKLGHRKSSRPPPPKPVVLPDIIDISAARADAELEERNRLRDMAAQAIGLQPYPDAQDSCYDCISTDDDEDYQHIPSFESPDVPEASRRSVILSPPIIHGPISRGSSSSVSIVPQPDPTSRVRSGSIVAHTAATTTSFAPIPPYPSTLSSLSSFRQCEGLYPKYYPHSSLRIFALSKNWKYRYLMMSSPATFVARGQTPAVSYLHVFKSGGSGEKELERLEINEDSVVFVAEDEAGGKRSVIKVGGADVGAMKKEYMIKEGGYSMWLLHIQNTVDAQRWITSIKNAILGQRTVRAGLIPAYPLGAHEPHGDMDVMLSIRTQGITSPTTVISKPVATVANLSVTGNSSYSTRSVHSSLKSVARPASPASLSALKGLFIGRPRSTSRPASIDAERDQEKKQFPTLSMPDSPSAVAVQNISAAQMNTASCVLVDRHLDRKILTTRLSPRWKGGVSTNGDTTARKTDLILPLQPPPRKRWTASGLSPLNANINNAFSFSGRPNSLQMSMDKLEMESTQIDTCHFGTPEHRPRVSSLQSVSTFTSGERRISIERSSASTKRSSTRRWSKQSLLPSLMSPPTDPLPPVPVHRTNTSQRTSGESSHSTNSSGKYSIQNPATCNSRRSSMPPPRPAPTSALPPTPIDLGQDELNHDVLKPLETMSSTSKASFRTSSHRASRLSMPKPPPNTSLPPRPDDPDYNSRRRSSSESRYPTALQSIPLSSSTHDDAHLLTLGSLPPAPPPASPLPAPPVDQLPSTSRVTSLKQRLRILSTGNAVPVIGRSRFSTDSSSIDFSSPTTFSPPSTPIAEKIIPVQDDSFLQLYTPILSTPPFLLGRPSPPQDQVEQDLESNAVTSLSPPPRRGPKHTSESDYMSPTNLVFPLPEEQLNNTSDGKKHLLVSPPLSPRSSQNSRRLPEGSEMVATSDEWVLAEDSSGTETRLGSFLDSEYDHDEASSRPSSIISLGLMSI